MCGCTIEVKTGNTKYCDECREPAKRARVRSERAKFKLLLSPPQWYKLGMMAEMQNKTPRQVIEEYIDAKVVAEDVEKDVDRITILKAELKALNKKYGVKGVDQWR